MLINHFITLIAHLDTRLLLESRLSVRHQKLFERGNLSACKVACREIANA
jgi:hypothetical protein